MVVCMWLILVALDCDVYIFLSVEGQQRETKQNPACPRTAARYNMFFSDQCSRAEATPYIMFPLRASELR